MRLLRMIVVMTVLLVAGVGNSQASGDNQCAYLKAQIIANLVTARNLKIAARRNYIELIPTWEKLKNSQFPSERCLLKAPDEGWPFFLVVT